MDNDVHARIQKALSEEVQINSDNVYFYFYYFIFGWCGETERTQLSLKRVIIGPPANAFRWRADDDPTLNADFVALWVFQVIRSTFAKLPYSCPGGGGPDPLSPTLSESRMAVYAKARTYVYESPV